MGVAKSGFVRKSFTLIQKWAGGSKNKTSEPRVGTRMEMERSEIDLKIFVPVAEFAADLLCPPSLPHWDETASFEGTAIE
jgi:hypothetical protein